MKPRKHPAKDARITAKIYAAEVDQMKRAFGRLLHPDTPASTSVGGCAMTPDQIDLARRLVACPRWRWMPGMAGIDALGVPFRCALTHHSGGMMVVAGMAFMPTHPDALARMFPDLTDPATLGCLLALVREAWRDPEAHLALGAAGWVLMSGESRVADVVYPSPAGRTEAEALVNALEGAP